MTTGDVVRERAISLAQAEVDRDEAVRELEASSGGRRVAVVRARQQLAAGLRSDPDQKEVIRAVEFLDELLNRMPA